MEISNINDLSDLIKEKERVFTFRMLEKKDSQNILEIMIKSFLNDNPVFAALNITEEDIRTDFSAELFELMVQKNLSFGAFHGDKLVSACLSFDFTQSKQMNVKGTVYSKRMEEVAELVHIALGKYYNSKNIEQNQISYLSHLATSADYFQQQLALLCSYLSVQESKKQGFKQMLTLAGHLGTLKAFTKIFKNVEKINEINEVKGQPVVLVSLIAQLASC